MLPKNWSFWIPYIGASTAAYTYTGTVTTILAFTAGVISGFFIFALLLSVFFIAIFGAEKDQAEVSRWVNSNMIKIVLSLALFTAIWCYALIGVPLTACLIFMFLFPLFLGIEKLNGKSGAANS